MGPVSLIVVALTAGAAAAGEDAADGLIEATKDAVAALCERSKAAIAGRVAPFPARTGRSR
jgi:hypothetical protein